MEIAIMGSLMGFINLLIAYELNRMNNSIVRIAEESVEMGKELATIKATVHACPTCREATER